MKKSLIQEAIEASPNRRSFVRKVGLASAAVGAGLAVDLKEAKGATTTDINVANFALNLEFLESEFYTVATTGKTLEESGFYTGPSSGPTYGGKKVSFPNNLLFTSTVANQIAEDERAHVKLLLGLLGSAAIKKPTINLDALGFGFGSENDFLKLGRIFEDIGVSAYAGAAPLLSSAVVATAARILAAEGEHVSNLRLQVARLNISTAPPLDSVDILPPPSGTRFFSLNSDGLCAVRTPGQVLYLAYGAGGVDKGGFFPDGVNGVFRVSSTSPA